MKVIIKNYLSILILGVSIVFFYFTFIHYTYATDWWNNSWKYRHPLYVNEDTGFNHINHLDIIFINSSDIVNCSKEVRLVNDNSNEIPSYILNQENDGCKVVYMINITANSNETYFFYYGNLNADLPNYRMTNPPMEIENIFNARNEIEYLDKGSKLFDECRYMDAINLVENHCPDSKLYLYGASRCYYLLGYAYVLEFYNRGIEINIQNETKLINLASNEYLINKSNDYFLKSINLSWSNLTYKDFRMNEYRDLLFYSLIGLCNNYILMNNYEGAIDTLGKLQSILSVYPKSEYRLKMEESYKDLYSLIAEKIEVSLVGNIDPLDFSEPEIKAHITLKSENDTYFNELHVQFYDQKGLQNFTISKHDSTFEFNEKLLVEKKNTFFYPFEIYESDIFNVSPPRIRNDTVIISITGEARNYLDGKSFFIPDKILLRLERSTGNKLTILTEYILLLVGLCILYKKIIYQKKKLSTNKSIELFSFVYALVTIIIFITQSFKLQINLMNIILIIIFILIKFLKKYQFTKKFKIFSSRITMKVREFLGQLHYLHKGMCQEEFELIKDFF